MKLPLSFLKTLERYSLIASGDRLVVAISGGLDSVVLLRLLREWQDHVGYSLSAAHFNHHFRGEESDGDQSFVEALCRDWDVPLDVGHQPDVSDKENKHLMARQCRYDFLSDIAQKRGAHRVATAHHRDDHAETILLHLIRGSGTRGLAGLPRVGNWNGCSIIRPLLDYDKETLEAFTKSESLAYRFDSTNGEDHYRRNWIRHHLMPSLRELNPRVNESLAKVAKSVEMDNDFMDMEACLYFEKNHGFTCGALQLSVEPIRRLHPALQVRIIRMAVAQLVGFPTDLNADHIEHILGLMEKRKGMYQLSGGVVARCEGSFLVLSVPSPSEKE